MPVQRPRGLRHVQETSDIVLRLEMTADPGVSNIIENVGFMRRHALNRIFRRLQPLAREAKARMQQNAPWNDQDSEVHAAPRYPFGHAKEQLEAFAIRTDDRLGIVLQHSPKTIMRTKSGREITYGGILETEYNGPYAIIRPTWMKMRAEVMNRLQGAINEDFKGARPNAKGRVTTR